MSTRQWLGYAVALTQVDTITVSGTWATSDTATITINGKDLTVTVGTDTSTTNVATLIKEAFNGDTQTGTGDHTSSPTFADGGGSSIPEFRGITASSSGAVVTLTADVAGRPFTVTTSEVTASTDGVVGDPSSVTAATGPNHFDNADNWSGGAVPVDADDIVFDSGDVDCLYGIAQSAVTPTSITVTMGYTGKIGLPEINVDDTAYPYTEYRDTYLALGNSADATNIAVEIGDGPGSGSQRIKLDTGTSQTTVVVNGTGQAVESSIPTVLWKGTDSSNDVTVNRGNVGIGFFAGEVATVATLRVGYVSNRLADASVDVGDGCTLTTINQSGGSLTTRDNLTTMNLTGGTWIHNEGTVTTLNAKAATVYYKSNGTCTTANIYSGAVLDFRRDMRARTFTTTGLYANSSYYDPADTVTHTNGIDLQGCTVSDLVAFDIPSHKTVSLSTI